MSRSWPRPPTLDEIRAERARRSLVEYTRQAWALVEPGTPYVHGMHIDAIAEHLEAVSRGQIRKLIINIPPRHMKSLAVAVFWPTWDWIDNPQRRFLAASYAAVLSTRDAVRSRRVLQSPWYRSRWGHVFDLAYDQNEKRRYENDKGGYRIATSVGGSATGDGGDILILDDPHKASDAQSDRIRENDLEWWKETWSTRLNDPRTGAEVIVMQRLHERDVTGYILAEVGGYEHLCLPARYEPDRTITTSIGWSDPRAADGQLLWPERYDDQELKDLERKLGSYGTAGQLQQRPAPTEGGIFKRHWWRFWAPEGTDLPPVSVKTPTGEYLSVQPVPLPRLEQQAQSWDMAFKDTKSSAFVVGQTWGRRGADKFLLDQLRDKMDFVQTLAAVQTLTDRFPDARAKWVEDKANGPAVISALRSKIAGLIACEPDGSKEARAHAASPEVQAGNVYLPHPAIAPWVWDLINECATFPNGAYKDQVDTLTQAILRLGGHGQKRSGVWGR